jgi:hypothetical protein
MEANRQLPLGAEIFLDHIAHFVRDREAAAKALACAGFAPTPISIQTDKGQLTGTGNVTAMLTRGYIEVLFKTADTPLGQELDAALARYSGVHLMAFGVAHAVAESARLERAGFHIRPIVELRRPVATQTGHAQAAFTVARVDAGDMAEGRIQMLTHHTEDAVWQKRWLTHSNGARQLIDVVAAVASVEEAAARYARFLGRKAAATRTGWGVTLDRGGVQLMDANAFSRLVPGVPVPSLPFIGAYAIGVESRNDTAAILRANGMALVERDGMLLVPFPPELGQGAWIFVERSTDLPWRANS